VLQATENQRSAQSPVCWRRLSLSSISPICASNTGIFVKCLQKILKPCGIYIFGSAFYINVFSLNFVDTVKYWLKSDDNHERVTWRPIPLSARISGVTRKISIGVANIFKQVKKNETCISYKTFFSLSLKIVGVIEQKHFYTMTSYNLVLITFYIGGPCSHALACCTPLTRW
jgi:hypothetical protein